MPEIDPLLGPLVQLGSFGLVAYIVLRTFNRFERTLELHTRVVAELVITLNRSSSRPPSNTRSSVEALNRIHVRREDSDE